MIRRDMRPYEYTLIGERDAYGQPTLLDGAQGIINMAIYVSTQAEGGSILYTDADYIGLTNDASISDKMLIDYQGQKLKVLHIQPKGRHIQAALKRVQ